jgi:single-strand DNA-binding protein
MNIAVLMGRMTSTPELKTTPNGLSVTSFSIAVDRGYGENKQTDFINIVGWRQTAEFICKYFTQGSRIAIEGSIQTRKYQNRDGNNRTVFEVVANNVHFVDTKSAKPSVDVSPDADPLKTFAEKNSDFVEMSGGDDLPF